MYSRKEKVEEEINYSNLLDKARNCIEENKFDKCEYLVNLALLAPNLDKNTKINLYSLKSYIHYKFKSEIQGLNCVSKALTYLKHNKKLNDADIGFCLSKILYRGAKYFYPEIRQYNYYSCYLLYTAKILVETLKVKEEKNKMIIEEEFINTLKEIVEEVNLFFITFL